MPSPLRPLVVDDPDDPTTRTGLPVVVIGAGPVGLAAAVHLLDKAGWTGPDPEALPTGADLLGHYLEPLAALPALSSRIRLESAVVAVARHALDKVRSPGRDRLPFLVRVRDGH